MLLLWLLLLLVQEGYGQPPLECDLWRTGSNYCYVINTPTGSPNSYTWDRMAAKCSVDVWPQKTGNQLASLIVEKNMSTLSQIINSSAVSIGIVQRPYLVFIGLLQYNNQFIWVDNSTGVNNTNNLIRNCNASDIPGPVTPGSCVGIVATNRFDNCFVYMRCNASTPFARLFSLCSFQWPSQQCPTEAYIGADGTTCYMLPPHHSSVTIWNQQFCNASLNGWSLLTLSTPQEWILAWTAAALLNYTNWYNASFSNPNVAILLGITSQSFNINYSWVNGDSMTSQPYSHLKLPTLARSNSCIGIFKNQSTSFETLGLDCNEQYSPAIAVLQKPNCKRNVEMKQNEKRAKYCASLANESAFMDLNLMQYIARSNLDIPECKQLFYRLFSKTSTIASSSQTQITTLNITTTTGGTTQYSSSAPSIVTSPSIGNMTAATTNSATSSFMSTTASSIASSNTTLTTPSSTTTSTSTVPSSSTTSTSTTSTTSSSTTTSPSTVPPSTSTSTTSTTSSSTTTTTSTTPTTSSSTTTTPSTVPPSTSTTSTSTTLTTSSSTTTSTSTVPSSSSTTTSTLASTAQTTSTVSTTTTSTSATTNGTTTIPTTIIIVNTTTASTPKTTTETYTDILQNLANATITKDNVTAALATLNRTMIKMGSQTTEVVLQYISIILLKACAIPGLNHTDFMLFMNSFDTVLLTDTSTFQTSDSQKSSETMLSTFKPFLDNLAINSSDYFGNNIALSTHKGNCTLLGLKEADQGDFSKTLQGQPVDNSDMRTGVHVSQELACLNPDARLSFMIMRNQKLFQQPPQRAKRSTTDSQGTSCQPQTDPATDRVVTALYLVNGTSLHSIPGTVSLSFQPNQTLQPVQSSLHASYVAGYWNSTFWSTQGCQKVGSDGTSLQFACNHLTDFTLLVDYVQNDPSLCDQGLDTTGDVLAGLSALFLAVLLIIAIVDSVRASKSPSRRRAQQEDILGIPFLLTLILFFVLFEILSNSNLVGLSDSGCSAAAAVLYTLMVSVICWTTFQGFAFFKKFVQILGHSRFLDIVTNPWVSVGICAAIPIALTVILWLADNEFFVRSDSYCWIRPTSVPFAIIIPLSLLLVGDLVLTWLVCRRIFCNRFTDANSRVIQSQKGRRRSFWRKIFALVLMQIVLGTPWILQYFTIGTSSITVFHYIFTILNASQGIFLAILYAISRCGGWRKSFLAYSQRLRTTTRSIDMSLDQSAAASNGNTVNRLRKANMALPGNETTEMSAHYQLISGWDSLSRREASEPHPITAWENSLKESTNSLDSKTDVITNVSLQPL